MRENLISRIVLTELKKQLIVDQMHSQFPTTVTSNNVDNYIFYCGITIDKGDFVCAWHNYVANTLWFYPATYRDCVNVEKNKFLIVKKKKMQAKEISRYDGSNFIKTSEVSDGHSVIKLSLDKKSQEFNIMMGRLYLPYVGISTLPIVTESKKNNKITTAAVNTVHLQFYSYVIEKIPDSTKVILSYNGHVYIVPAKFFKENCFEETKNETGLSKICLLDATIIDQFQEPPF